MDRQADGHTDIYFKEGILVLVKHMVVWADRVDVKMVYAYFV